MSRENVLRVDFVLIWVIVTDNNDALNKIYKIVNQDKAFYWKSITYMLQIEYW